MFVRTKMKHGVHLLLTVCTAGLWLVSWVSLWLGKIFRPWRCQHCGWHNPQFDRAKKKKSVPADDLVPSP